jgi:hypothetical protein
MSPLIGSRSVDEGIGVVGLIGDDRAWVDIFEQRFSARS